MPVRKTISPRRRLYPAVLLATLFVSACAGSEPNPPASPPNNTTTSGDDASRSAAAGASPGTQSARPSLAGWEPKDTHGKYVPVTEAYYQSFDVPACGGTVTIATGEVRKTEYKGTPQQDGSMRVDYQGAITLDITRHGDGAFLDELDAPGTGWERRSKDGKTSDYYWEAPSLITAFDEVEAKAYAEKGLPQIFYFTGGHVQGKTVSGEDPGSPSLSARIDGASASGVKDVCKLLDASTMKAPTATNSP